MIEPCMIISTDRVPTNSAVMRPAISIYFSIRDARCWRITSCNALRPSINAMAMMTATSTEAQAINRSSLFPMMTRALIVFAQSVLAWQLRLQDAPTYPLASQ